ncbi:hypothetical protein V8C86DRAFT_2591326, partial [Haematococcus lacustris]
PSAALQHIRGVAIVVRATPHIAYVPMLLLAASVSLGVWGTTYGSNKDADSARLSAQTRLDSVASTLELTFLQASLPAKQVADMVKHTPDVPTLQTIWNDRVPTWWSWAPQGAEGLGVYMAPQGHVTASYPNTSRNQQVLGLDTLTGQFREETLVQISRADVITAGPFPILGQSVVTTSIPIFFTNTSADETWGSPRQATNCSICYNQTTRTKW